MRACKQGIKVDGEGATVEKECSSGKVCAAATFKLNDQEGFMGGCVDADKCQETLKTYEENKEWKDIKVSLLV